ncbi:MAG: alpha/beta fold hydrolase [Planctomycetota bacterium]|nr:alpha/beta fold hydrolase [Planctomycetota bacterium]
MTDASRALPSPSTTPIAASSKAPAEVGRRRPIRRLLIALTVGYAVYLAAMFFLQGAILFPRHFAGHALPSETAPAGTQVLWLEPEPGVRVEAWLLPPMREATAPAGLAVFFHGNGELIEHNLPVAAEYQRRGFWVLLPEYRGYGRSTGTPGERAIVADMQALITRALASAPIDSAKMILHGRSLGGGVAAQVAGAMSEQGRAPRALVLESTFVSITAMAARRGVPAPLLRDPFRTDRVLPTLTFPILVAGSPDDELIPFSNSRELVTLNPRARLHENGGRHNSFPTDWGAFWTAIDALLGEAGLSGE